MKTTLLNEAFKALDLLEEQDFNLSDKKSMEDAKEFIDTQEEEVLEIIDAEAEDETEIKDDYVGKVILDCCVCHSLIYKKADEVIFDEDCKDDDMCVNVDEECPYCMSTDGFKVVGQVAPFKPDPEVKVEVEPKEDGEEAEVTVDVDGDGKADVKIEVEPSDEEKEVEVTEEPKEEEKVEESLAEDSDKYLVFFDGARFTVCNDKKDLCPLDSSTYDNLENFAKFDSKEEADEFAKEFIQSKEQIEDFGEEVNTKDYSIKTVKDAIEGGFVDNHINESLNEEKCEICGKDVDEPCEECKEEEKIEEAVEAPSEDMLIEAVVGDTVKIIEMDGEPQYAGKVGEVTEIDDEGQLHGTWGGCAIIPSIDKFEVIKAEEVKEELCPECGKKVEEPCEDCKKEELKEGLENINLETDKEKINIAVEEKPEVEGEEMIVPLADDTSSEILQNNGAKVVEEVPAEEPVEEVVEEPSVEELPEEPVTEEETEEGEEEPTVDVDFNEFDEEAFNNIGESYLKNVYENVNSFKTVEVSQKDNTLMIEGIITFASGKEKKTNFVFEAKDASKRGKVRFIGENLQIAKGHKAFQMSGKIEESKFTAESLNYNYRQKLTEGKSTRVYGTVNNKK